jgi:hypothetical protein
MTQSCRTQSHMPALPRAHARVQTYVVVHRHTRPPMIAHSGRHHCRPWSHPSYTSEILISTCIPTCGETYGSIMRLSPYHTSKPCERHGILSNLTHHHEKGCHVCVGVACVLRWRCQHRRQMSHVLSYLLVDPVIASLTRVRYY